MIKTLMKQMGTRATTKVDVAIGFCAAVLALGHAIDTARQYKQENSESTTEENQS